jgi:hypothetical protein
MTRGLVVTFGSVLLVVVAAMLLCLSAAVDPATAACDRSSSGVPSTPMEAALEQLRRRFPNQIVIGFEEVSDEQRPACEPQIDLGPPWSSVGEALERVQEVDPKYRVELLPGHLVHVSPARGTADPPGLLDLVLRNFGVPPDDCLESAMTDGIARGTAASYTPELGDFLWHQQEAWDRSHGNPPRGIIGSILGDCYPSSRPGNPMYHNVTLRKALNIMATRSLQVARGEARSNGPYYVTVKALSWKYRFRSDPASDTGLGGNPIFQTF